MDSHFEGFDKIDTITLSLHRSLVTDRMSYRESLARVIYSILREDPSLFYYQGFHDIVEFFLLVSRFDIDWTYTVMKALTHSYLRDYMQSNFEEVQKLLELLYPVLEKRAPELVPILQNPVFLSTHVHSR